MMHAITASVNGQPKCKIEYYSTEHGLSHKRVTAILKDHEGFMWFGSWDGINRFNGYDFVSYKSSPGDSSQLKNDRIDQIVEDQSGYLWMLAYDNQVYRFDKKREQFLPLTTILNINGRKFNFNRIIAASNNRLWLQSVNDGIFCVSLNKPGKDRLLQYHREGPANYQLPSNSISFFYTDSLHQIWIGTKDGMCCLAQTNGVYKASKIPTEGIASGRMFTTMAEDQNCVYFGSADGYLATYYKQAKKFQLRQIASSAIHALLRSKKHDVLYATTNKGELLTINLRDQTIVPTAYHTGEPLFSLFEDRTGLVWIEPGKTGIIRFDPQPNSFQYYSQQNKEGLNTIGNRFKVLEDNNGLLWINMKGGGFGYYNRENQTIDDFLNTPDAERQTLPKLIYAIFYDNNGILWMTTYEKELVKIVVQENDFKQQLLVEHDASTSDNEVRGIFYDNKNRLWIGSKSGVIHVYQQHKKLGSLFENEPAQGLGLVYSILQDSRGNIWFGTKGNGLYKATPINKEETKYRLTHFVYDAQNSNSLPCNEIYALLEDRQGRIWIGSYDKGLSMIIDNNLSTSFVHSGPAFDNYPKTSFRRIRHLALDGKGNIWIASTDGLILLNMEVGKSERYQYTVYRKMPGDKESLSNNDVQFIYRDRQNRMWLATSGGGFSEAVGNQPYQSLRFRNYTTKNGLPNDYVLSCAEDMAGNIWIATENGLSKFSPGQSLFRNYDVFDGLIKAGFSEAAVCKPLTGDELVFGTAKGYLSFNPGQINSSRIAANIAFTNLHINNESAGPGLAPVALESNINYINELRLQHNQNIISIDYTILDHRAGNRQTFAYRLIGFDTTWQDDRQQRRATYTNLPPGNYVFEVKSMSSDLYSNTPFKRLAITILPPPWKTWWAYLIYIVLIATILFFIRRYAIAMIRLRNKIAVEQKLGALKLNFFTNISHELRTPLTLIVNPLEQLSRKEHLSPQAASFVDVARKNADRMVRFINQLLDLRKVQSDKASLRISRVELNSFVSKIVEHFTEAAASRQITLEKVADQPELFAWVDAEKLDVVIYNLVGNAVKFSPDSKKITISVRSNPAENSFSIAVRDQGPGVEKEQLEEIFELFHEGDHLTNRGLKGTGIGLALSKEFVQLHGGTIWATNNPDSGLTVTINMQLGSDHYNQEHISFVDMPQLTASPDMPVGEKPAFAMFGKTVPNDQKASTVLLVEDNDELRNFLTAQLSEYYHVETAADGEEGLEKAIALFPDLIISDIMMPKMDGIQMLDKIKNDLNTSHIPVVLLSARYSIESQIEGLKYGADCYITKPFNNEYLVATIDNLLAQRRKLFNALVEKKKPEVQVETAGPEAIPAPLITSRDEAFLKDVIRVIEEKMADVDFNIETVAGSMAMSRTTFYKKFKSLTGLAPVEFVRDLRLQRAKQFLDSGEYNVSEVAYLVGFSNPKYFSTCFREKYQLSPSDYQKTKTI